MEIKYKQFVVIPKRPKMSAGKMVSQGCHATFMALEKTDKNMHWYKPIFHYKYRNNELNRVIFLRN
ncbi:hypothetical protein LCGC14_2386860 [marine sediment metagenome]|uniref:peptidyl-tRNA hydrolase n=1 Tax=marine sediment metagenome TaxID=412755 RepID=A0A0F8VCF6_9ZZZZ